MSQEEFVAPVVQDVVEPAAEKMLPQSKVDQIVKHAKFSAAEKARNEAMASMGGMGGMGGVSTEQPQQQGSSPEQIRALVAEETQKQQQAMFDKANADANKRAGQEIAQQFFGKLEAGAAKYEDFSDKVGTLPFAKIPEIVQMSNAVDNTDDVMYELASNPMKLASLSHLHSIDPVRAASEMTKLSDSIKSNDSAKKSQVPNDPLSQVKSNPNPMGNGASSVSDFRRLKSLRG